MVKLIRCIECNLIKPHRSKQLCKQCYGRLSSRKEREKDLEKWNAYRREHNKTDKMRSYKAGWAREDRKRPETKVKRAAMETDRKRRAKQCAFCRSSDKLQFHHTNYEKKEGFTLCRPCHDKEHRHRKSGYTTPMNFHVSR